MIKNNFRILKKQYAYLQTILKTPVKFQKDWPKTVGGVADTRMVVGADGRTDGRTDRQTDGRTDTQNFGGYNIIPRHFLVAGHKNCIKKTQAGLTNSVDPVPTALGLYCLPRPICPKIYCYNFTYPRKAAAPMSPVCLLRIVHSDLISFRSFTFSFGRYSSLACKLPILKTILY